MNYLLDTHTFLWWSGNYDNLSPTAYDLCHDPANDLLLSLASVWEIQIKTQLGRLTLPRPLNEIIAAQMQQNRVTLLNIRLDHIYELGTLPPHHRDPFDRLLVAQARIENLPLVTKDGKITQYDVAVVW